MALAQGAIEREIHDQEWSIIRHAEVHYTHNVRMYQASDSARLLEKDFKLAIRYFGLQDLDSYLCIEVHVLTKVNIGEASTPNELDEAVVAELLSHTLSHL